jgi:hypothetical protein
MSDLCHLCDYNTMVNEARDQGGETWREQDEYGINVFVIPKGQQPDVHLHRDGTFGSQRKAWFNEIPDKCECGKKVKLKHPPSDWKPSAAPAVVEPDEPEPEPVETKTERPAAQRAPKKAPERLSLL